MTPIWPAWWPGADAWLPLVMRLRAEEGRTWDEVVRAVNARTASGAPDAPSGRWTRPRLLRAVRALARDGVLPDAVVLAGRGRRRTVADRERDSVLRAVAAIVGETPGATLREIGDRLAVLRCYPSRGGSHWSTSSIAQPAAGGTPGGTHQREGMIVPV
jgi:hypothetical protein